MTTEPGKPVLDSAGSRPFTFGLRQVPAWVQLTVVARLTTSPGTGAVPRRRDQLGGRSLLPLPSSQPTPEDPLARISEMTARTCTRPTPVTHFRAVPSHQRCTGSRQQYRRPVPSCTARPSITRSCDAVTSRAAHECPSSRSATDSGRGVLLDIPRLRASRWLEPGVRDRSELPRPPKAQRRRPVTC